MLFFFTSALWRFMWNVKRAPRSGCTFCGYKGGFLLPAEVETPIFKVQLM